MEVAGGDSSDLHLDTISEATETSVRRLESASSQRSEKSILTPVRNDRGTPNGSRPSSAGSFAGQRTPRLPPISGGGDFLNEENEYNIFSSDSDTDIGSIKTSDALKRNDSQSSGQVSPEPLDRPGEGHAHPKIVQAYKPERGSDLTPDPMDRQQDSRSSSKRSVSFTPVVDGLKKVPAVDVSKSRISKEVTTIKTYDGREIVMVTLDTQTDWRWAESAVNKGQFKLGRPSAHSDDVIHNDLSDINETSIIDNGRDSERNLSSPFAVKPRTDSHSARSQLSSKESHDDQDTKIDSESTPYLMPYNDEYGIPMLDLSSDTDSSDEEYSHQNQEDHNVIPSIGPPQILQYVRESEQPELSVVDPFSRVQNSEGDIFDNSFPMDDQGRPLVMFEGTCEFCKDSIKKFPTLDEQQQKAPEELYCCHEYRTFIEDVMTATMQLEKENETANKLISVKPHAHFGSKMARREARDRAVQRLRDREMQKRVQESSGLQQANFYASASSKGSTQATLTKAPSVSQMQAHGQVPSLTYKEVVARQMKTINFQLSSNKCLEEGWTIRPLTPLEGENDSMDIFVPEPLGPSMMGMMGKENYGCLARKVNKADVVDLWQIQLQNEVRERPLILKFYDDGKKFITLFPDGTGNVFYQSGNLAIQISSIQLGQYTYIIMEDCAEKPQILAIFEPNGFGCCYHKSGNLRLYLDQLSGIELNAHGGKKRRWSWKDQDVHVHAPPFQPICFGLNRHIGVRVMSQANIILTLNCKQRSCRFNMGSRLRMVAPENLPSKEIDENQLFIDERKAYVETLLDKVSNLLRFPKSPKVDKILPPIHLTNKIIKTEKLRKEKNATVRKKSSPVVTVN